MSDGNSSSDESEVPELVPRDEDDNVIADEDRDFDDEDKYLDSLDRAQDLFSEKSFATAEQCVDHCRQGFLMYFYHMTIMHDTYFKIYNTPSSPNALGESKISDLRERLEGKGKEIMINVRGKSAVFESHEIKTVCVKLLLGFDLDKPTRRFLHFLIEKMDL